MSGDSEKLFVLLHIFACCIVTCIARANDTAPTMHTIPLQNETVIPEEYKHLPLVGKCCSKGEVLVKNEKQKAVCMAADPATVEQFSPIFCAYNETGVIVPGKKQNAFVAIIGDPCKHRRYILDPEESKEDENHLLLNGSVFIVQEYRKLKPGINYCMEVIPGMGIKTIVCLVEDPVIITADSQMRIYSCVRLISVPFLILTIIAYSITPKLKDVYGKALCRYCGCLAVAFLTLAIKQLGSENLSNNTCSSIAYIIQFSFITCFFWLNVMCIELWSLVRSHVDGDTYKRMKPKTLFFWYSLWCWGPSAILILVSMIMDVNPAIPLNHSKSNISQESCWSQSDKKAILYIYILIGLLLLANVVLFILTFIKLTQYQRDLDLRRLARNQESDRQDRRFLRRSTRSAFVCMIIFFLMGLNWLLEFISLYINGNSVAWSTFDIVNALQGVLIFGLFVVRRPSRDYVWDRIQKLRGIDVKEPETKSMELCLLPIVNGDSVPRQTIIP